MKLMVFRFAMVTVMPLTVHAQQSRGQVSASVSVTTTAGADVHTVGARPILVTDFCGGQAGTTGELLWWFFETELQGLVMIAQPCTHMTTGIVVESGDTISCRPVQTPPANAGFCSISGVELR